MKKTIVLLAVLALLLGSVVPSDAWRGGHGHWRGGCCWGGWWWPGAVIGGLALGAVAAATYPLYAPPPVYAAPPVVYQAPPPVIYQQGPVAYQQGPMAYQQAPAPAAPPAPLVQREVVYPNGRYVLYGDGVSRPWQWVWVPAAQQAPPQPQ